MGWLSSYQYKNICVKRNVNINIPLYLLHINTYTRWWYTKWNGIFHAIKISVFYILGTSSNYLLAIIARMILEINAQNVWWHGFDMHFELFICILFYFIYIFFVFFVLAYNFMKMHWINHSSATKRFGGIKAKQKKTTFISCICIKMLNCTMFVSETDLCQFHQVYIHNKVKTQYV